MRKRTVFLIAVPCAVIIIVIWMCYPWSYDRMEPTKLGTVSIPEIQMTISLFCMAQPRASFITPYEGEYRILEVSQRDESPRYYDLPDTIPAETCHIDVFLYPTNSLIRFYDSGLTFDAQFRSETILDLQKRVLYSVVRHKARVYIAKLSSAMPTLSFPKQNEKSRVPSSIGISTSTSSANPDPVVEITVGDQVAQPLDDSWTKETGVFVGSFAPNGASRMP